MAGVCDLWVGELTKLSAKMRVRNPLLLISRKRDSAAAAAAAADQEAEESKETSSVKSARSEATMSETTVFLLMDRFAPT
ncbi:UNVERIFIED_CONTAM: hypothetical protein Sangu_1066000 [Sesamum angustifolium]|uniref:Uncharacterized protein n=1 Tax=Sesamum angustifolium TaxID=2727405 RepID=A0AAW2NXS5_9LAMI